MKKFLIILTLIIGLLSCNKQEEQIQLRYEITTIQDSKYYPQGYFNDIHLVRKDTCKILDTSKFETYKEFTNDVYKENVRIRCFTEMRYSYKMIN